jgi:hypothetical protein
MIWPIHYSYLHDWLIKRSNVGIFSYDAVKESAATECFTTFHLNLVIDLIFDLLSNKPCEPENWCFWGRAWQVVPFYLWTPHDGLCKILFTSNMMVRRLPQA